MAAAMIGTSLRTAGIVLVNAHFWPLPFLYLSVGLTPDKSCSSSATVPIASRHSR